MLDLLILSILIGFALGVISGLIPGIPTNNFALILLALSPAIADPGFSNIYIAAIILANSITHTILNITPSAYLGAPDAGTDAGLMGSGSRCDVKPRLRGWLSDRFPYMLNIVWSL